MLSLSAALNKCKVITGNAQIFDSERFFVPSKTLCNHWNHVDNAGRPVNSNTFVTRSPGCNSALEEITTENYLRPNYIEYLNSDATGLRGNEFASIQARSGDFDDSLYKNMYTRCGDYEQKIADASQKDRMQQMRHWGQTSQSIRRMGGF